MCATGTMASRHEGNGRTGLLDAQEAATEPVGQTHLEVRMRAEAHLEVRMRAEA